MKKKPTTDTRRYACPGCCWLLIKQRRARAGRLCPSCLRDRVEERR